MLNDVDRGIVVVKKAVDKDKENPRLYLQLIDMTMQKSPVSETEVISVIDQFMNRESADIDQKLMFAQRKVEFLEDFGTNILVSISEESSKKSKLESGQHSSQSTQQSSQMMPPSSSSANSAPGGQNPPPNYSALPYPPPQGPPGPGGYQGGSGQGGYQPPQPSYTAQPPYNQGPYNQSDPNYTNYQGWNYSQGGYGTGYNQGWGNYYNY